MKKNLEWFTSQYPSIDERYWAISDYITDEINKGNSNLEEFITFIREYTIAKVGLDPLEASKLIQSSR